MNTLTTRRDFLKTSAFTGASVGIPGTTITACAKPGSRRYPDELPEPLPKGLEYLLTFEKFVKNLKAESSEKIVRASEICARAVESGKKVYYTIHGHSERQPIMERRAGKPTFLLPLKRNFDPEIFQEGDVLITVRTSQCRPAINRGAKVIGILMPFQPQKTQGQGIVHTEYDGEYMEDICDVCIRDMVPYTVGIMKFDQLPIKAVPAHGAMDGLILGLILAGTIDILLSRGIKVEVT